MIIVYLQHLVQGIVIRRMNKINYQKQLLALVEGFRGERPTLLLHSCCGPCSTQVISFLKDYFTITVFYYNPNIEPKEEYEKRKQEQIRFLKEFQDKHGEIVSFFDCDYDHEVYEAEVGDTYQMHEGGKRCAKCFYLRLNKTASVAKENGFAYFGTTLTVSPHKNSQVINHIGEVISKSVEIPFIYGDFKKNDGYKKSILLSREYHLYRQDYCGCLYGKERF